MSATNEPRGPLVELQALGFDAGAHLLVKHALADVAVGECVSVQGLAPGWHAQLAAWCKAQGHELQTPEGWWQAAQLQVRRGVVQVGRWRGAAQTGRSDAAQPDAVADRAEPVWGLAARGAAVEQGAPAFNFRLSEKAEFWSDSAGDLYAQAVAAQWSADVDIDWDDAPEPPAPIEDAIVQIMTYMVENENAALVVPARFLGELHPHYREMQAALAIQIADEARHIDVFTRRIRRHGREPALSTAGGQASLMSLLDEKDYSVAGFLLSVLGEGTFVNLLQFLQTDAPDPLTRQICRLAARDEARHVALGMSHLLHRLKLEPTFRHRLAQAVEARHDALAGTAGLNEEVFDALILVAAGELTPEAVARGAARVQQLMQDMADGRYAKLVRLGFEKGHAQELASLHTRNFM
ncbi:ferritin-like domain-containing protein [Diaphorobacter caeni]|uniref:ferritin-like domain-containing protein n=1 Tax=Diaphorobacter caeni TaxID=2784387 RepID=UPI00188E493A|nr:ferritin-like domain-containing protein [Diaphorobacter caeni]MBF5006138.1 ferritin-like domain-containing protein [Diaphorobacter caeni]